MSHEIDWILLDMNPLAVEETRLLRRINKLLDTDDESARKLIKKLVGK